VIQQSGVIFALKGGQTSVPRTRTSFGSVISYLSVKLQNNNQWGECNISHVNGASGLRLVTLSTRRHKQITSAIARHNWEPA